MNAHASFARDFDLTSLFRRENIIEVRHDRLLDRFNVVLSDYRCGGGASVGEALANAQRRAQ